MEQIKYNRLVRVKIQVGIFSYLKNRGYRPREIKNIVERYAIDVLGHSKPIKKRLQWYKSMEQLIIDDFNAFKKYVKATYRIKKTMDYNDWYDQASQDGSLAYNGSSKDF